MYKFVACSLFFLCGSMVGTDIKLSTKTDIQILKLHFLLALKTDCKNAENGAVKVPLCKTINEIVQQCDNLLSRGTMSFSELLIPIVNAMKSELQDIKDAIHAMNQEVKVQKDGNEDKELLDLIANLEAKLKDPKYDDVAGIQEKFNIILERYAARLNK